METHRTVSIQPLDEEPEINDPMYKDFGPPESDGPVPTTSQGWLELALISEAEERAYLQEGDAFMAAGCRVQVNALFARALEFEAHGL